MTMSSSWTAHSRLGTYVPCQLERKTGSRREYIARSHGGGSHPDNRDFSVRNIEADRSGQNLFDPFYEAPYSLHFSVGMQRELARHLVAAGRGWLHIR
jgi:hypothetical protein